MLCGVSVRSARSAGSYDELPRFPAERIITPALPQLLARWNAQRATRKGTSDFIGFRCFEAGLGFVISAGIPRANWFLKNA